MDAAARRAVRDAGYEYACAVEATTAEIGLMALPRLYVGEQDDARRMTVKRLLYRARIAMRSRREGQTPQAPAPGGSGELPPRATS
jgi:hypothetical protein